MSMQLLGHGFPKPHPLPKRGQLRGQLRACRFESETSVDQTGLHPGSRARMHGNVLDSLERFCRPLLLSLSNVG